MEDCIFCKIVGQKIPSAKLYEDERFLVFLDIAPSNPGHTLIVTKNHAATILDAKDEDLQEMLPLAKKIANAITKATDAPGFNIMINNDKVSGQIVPHIHMHIIPRHEGDKIDFDWNQTKYNEGEMEKMVEEIKRHL